MRALAEAARAAHYGDARTGRRSSSRRRTVDYIQRTRGQGHGAAAGRSDAARAASILWPHRARASSCAGRASGARRARDAASGQRRAISGAQVARSRVLRASTSTARPSKGADRRSLVEQHAGVDVGDRAHCARACTPGAMLRRTGKPLRAGAAARRCRGRRPGRRHGARDAEGVGEHEDVLELPHTCCDPATPWRLPGGPSPSRRPRRGGRPRASSCCGSRRRAAHIIELLASPAFPQVEHADGSQVGHAACQARCGATGRPPRVGRHRAADDLHDDRLVRDQVVPWRVPIRRAARVVGNARGSTR